MENKPVYKELQVGKKHLTAFSIVFMILSAIAIVGSIVLFICSSINLGNEQKIKFVICLVFGIIVGGIVLRFVAILSAASAMPVSAIFVPKC